MGVEARHCLQRHLPSKRKLSRDAYGHGLALRQPLSKRTGARAGVCVPLRWRLGSQAIALFSRCEATVSCFKYRTCAVPSARSVRVSGLQWCRPREACEVVSPSAAA